VLPSVMAEADEETMLRSQVAQLESLLAQQKQEIARQNDEILEQKLEMAKLQMTCEAATLQLEVQQAAQLQAQRQETRNRSIAALGDKLDTATSLALRKDTLCKLNLSGVTGGQAWLVADLLASSSSLTVTNLFGNQFDIESSKLLVEAVADKDISLCGIEADTTSIDFSKSGLKSPEAMLLASDLSKAGVSGSLTELNLQYNELGEEGAKVMADALHGNDSLTSISLLANEFDDATVAMLLKLKEEKPTLTTLCGLKPGQKEANFAGWGLTAQVAKLLAPEVVASDTMEEVNLDGFALPVKAIKGTKAVQDLQFNGKRLGTPSTVVIGALVAVNTSLMSLKLLHNHIGTAGAKPLAAALLVNNSLVEVNLDGFALPVKELKGTEPVDSLNFSGQELNVASAVVIGALVGVNASITSLNVSENKIGAEGLKPLADALHTNKSLTELNVCLNDIGPEAGKPLADALRVNESLKNLNMSFNRLCGVNMRGEGFYTDEGIAAISDAMLDKCCLTRFDVSYNHLDSGANGVELLKEAVKKYEGFQLIAGCNANALGGTNKQKWKSAGLVVMASNQKRS